MPVPFRTRPADPVDPAQSATSNSWHARFAQTWTVGRSVRKQMKWQSEC